jgi:hypothetical protein
MLRVWMLVGIGCVLAGCPSPSTYVRVRAFTAPRDATGNFAVINHPWSIEAAGATRPRGDAELLAPLQDFLVTCTTGSCKQQAKDGVELKSALGTRVELAINKPGYEPVKLVVSVEQGERTYIVLLRPVAGVAP